MRFSLTDPWARHLFIALCRRYGLQPYRCASKASSCGHRRVSLDEVLWPEFQEINAALTEYLPQVTDRVIRVAVYKNTGDAEEVADPEKLGR